MAEAWAYLFEEASEVVARRLLAETGGCFEALRHFPQMGASRAALRPGLRVIFHENYAIYYLVQATEVVVVRVLHGSRDVEGIWEEGGFEV